MIIQSAVLPVQEGFEEKLPSEKFSATCVLTAKTYKKLKLNNSTFLFIAQALNLKVPVLWKDNFPLTDLIGSQAINKDNYFLCLVN